MTDHITRTTRWWGDSTLSLDAIARWQIGPCGFWLARNQVEWRLGDHPVDQDVAADLAHEVQDDQGMPEHTGDIRRLALRRTGGRVRLTPRLADRPVVIQPAQPIALPPQQEVTLYFSSPLWLLVEVDDPLVEFVELPLQRPSDTWFGPNTREGELCYSLRTSARLQLENVPRRPHRAVTELRVVNQADSSLPIDRVKVPLPAMSLFATPAGDLWTESITLERRDEGEDAEIKLNRRPTTQAASATLVSDPRAPLPRGNLLRAFGGLMGGR
jgi:hypothetical protein